MGAPARVIREFAERRYVPVLSPPVVAELLEVLNRPRIRNSWRLSAADVAELLLLAMTHSVIVRPPGTLHLCRDPKDDIVLETAILGGATHLVTRDDDMKRDQDLVSRLREHGVAVVSVAQFLAMLDEPRRADDAS
jgi:putative PIN family toxin of toxin-antitoxin system